MSDMNIVAINGRLTRDAELKYTNSGMAICKFSIATNRSVKKGDKWEDEANFFECTMFGKRAESINQYLTKGQQVSISGELRQERWEKDGKQNSRVTISVNNLQLIGGKSDNTKKEPRNNSNENSGAPENFIGDSFDDSQIPF